jgi:hypothetical protein
MHGQQLLRWMTDKDEHDVPVETNEQKLIQDFYLPTSHVWAKEWVGAVSQTLGVNSKYTDYWG